MTTLVTLIRISWLSLPVDLWYDNACNINKKYTGRDNHEILINVTSVVITSIQEETTTRFLLMLQALSSQVLVTLIKISWLSLLVDL
jgi:hypothetical protein